MKAEVRKIAALWRLKQLKSGGPEEVVWTSATTWADPWVLVLLHNASYLIGTKLLGEPVSSCSEGPNDGNKGLCIAVWLAEGRITEMPMSGESLGAHMHFPGLLQVWLLTLNQDQLHNFQSPLQNENARPLVQQLLWMSRGYQQSIKSSTRSFWAKSPEQLHRSQAHETGPALDLALDTRYGQ